MKIDSPNIPNRILLDEVSSSNTPASGKISLYGKTDGLLYMKDDSGNEYLASVSKEVNKIGVTLLIDGGDVPITNVTDDKVVTEVPYNCSITSYVLTSIDGTSGSISVIIEKNTYSSFPSSFSTLGTLSISSSTKNSGTVSWNLSEGDIIRARISGTPSNIKKLSISLKGTKT